MIASSPALGGTVGHAPTGRRERGRGAPPRLVALAVDELHVVRAAGGLLYDRSMMGWDITGDLTEYRDDRPLRILGVGFCLFDGDSGYTRPALDRHSPVLRQALSGE